MKKQLDWFWRSGASFDPSTLPNILAWWDNGISYMAADGSLWTDKIGGYNVAATGTARPTLTAASLNGRPSFTFSGVNVLEAARVPAFQGLAGITIWSVGKRFCWAHDFNVNNRTNHLHYNIGDLSYANIANVASNAQGYYSPGNVWQYSILVFDGSQPTNDTKTRQWKNGVEQTLTFSGTMPSTTESNASSILQIGAFVNKGVKNAGDSCEHGVIGRAITAQEIVSLNAYLAEKYSL